MMNCENKSSERWGLLWRPYHKGIRRVADLYTKRNLWAAAALRHAISEVEDNDIRDALLFGFTAVILNATKMYRELKRSIASGLYYIPSLSRDLVLMHGYEYKVKSQLVPGYQELSALDRPSIAISTQSATSLSNIPTNSIDYIFTDPPYSWKVQYGEINFVCGRHGSALTHVGLVRKLSSMK
jgi:adenine-specific DNA methylase